jgi:hypothetical protein
MPDSQAEGDFSVTTSANVSKIIVRLDRKAVTENRSAEFRTALRTIFENLRLNPLEVGEPIKNLKALQLQIRAVALRPIYLEFGVHPKRRMVFVRVVKLMGVAS